MPKAKRIFIIEDIKDHSGRFLLSGLRKMIKGYIRLGHDVQLFNYRGAFSQVAPVKSRILSRRRCKKQVDEYLVGQVKNYRPDIVQTSFVNFLDVEAIAMLRDAAPNAVFMAIDGDPWPEYRPERIAVGSKLDLVLATNDGKWLDAYREKGVQCEFMPNPCDPDIDYRYEVEDKWKSDLLFTGKTRQVSKRYPTDPMRYEVICRMAEMDNCAFYGCMGGPKIGGLDYMHAISGARIALSINIANDVKFYHSDRLTHYLACGTMALARRVPESDMLFADGVHIKYFDTADEFSELAKWYLEHEDERVKIANAGMQRAHAEFSGEKIAKYALDIIETGDYSAPWRQRDCVITSSVFSRDTSIAEASAI